MGYSSRGHKESDTVKATNTNTNIKMLTPALEIYLIAFLFLTPTNKIVHFTLKEFNSHSENSRALVYKASSMFRKRGKAV